MPRLGGSSVSPIGALGGTEEIPFRNDTYATAQTVANLFKGTKASDIASATTTDIGAATGIYVHITGTTTITGLGTVAAGAMRWLRFSGALTLTHNATSLILPTGANISTATDDSALFVSEGSGNWVCLGYWRKSGQPLVAASGTPADLIVALGDETTAITVGTAKVTLRAPRAMTLSAAKASLSTASSSGLPQFDVKKNGTTIFSTKPTIDATEKTTATAATPSVLSTTAIAADDELTFDVVTAGTGATGAKITLVATA